MANDVRHRGRERPETGDTESRSEATKRPFDTSGVSWVPEHDDNDPPYRDWWVIDSERDNE